MYTGGDAGELCGKNATRLKRAGGEPDETGKNYRIWSRADAVTKVLLAGRKCQTLVSDPAFAQTDYQIQAGDLQCWAAIDPTLGDKGELGPGDAATCHAGGVSSRSRVFRVDKEQYVYVNLRTDADADAVLKLYFVPEGTVGYRVSPLEAAKETASGSSVYTIDALFDPGCYAVEVSTTNPTTTGYSLTITGPKGKAILPADPEEDESADDQLELDGPGPSLADIRGYEADVARYDRRLAEQRRDAALGSRFRLDGALSAAFVDEGNMYGLTASIGVEAWRRPRVRLVAGATLGFLLQSQDEPAPSDNTILPVALWGGVRFRPASRVTLSARAGFLGHLVSTDDGSDTGAGYLAGVEATFGMFLLGMDRMLLEDTVHVFRVGLAF